MRIFIIFLMITFNILIILTFNVHARVIEFDGQQIIVRVTQGRTTQVELPEAVANIITGIDQNKLSLEHSKNRIFIHPIIFIEGDIFVITENNHSYPFSLVIGEESNRDVTVVVNHAAMKAQEKLKTFRHEPSVLLRAMMMGKELEGIDIVAHHSEIIYNDGSIIIRLEKTFMTPSNLRGYVMIIENISDLDLNIPLQKIYFDGLIAIAAEREFLSRKPITPDEKMANNHISKLYMIRTF